MSSFVFLVVGVFIFVYFWVWTRPKRVEQPPEPPVIDRRWRIFDREKGGYIIFVEAVV